MPLEPCSECMLAPRLIGHTGVGVGCESESPLRMQSSHNFVNDDGRDAREDHEHGHPGYQVLPGRTGRDDGEEEGEEGEREDVATVASVPSAVGAHTHTPPATCKEKEYEMKGARREGEEEGRRRDVCRTLAQVSMAYLRYGARFKAWKIKVARTQMARTLYTPRQ